MAMAKTWTGTVDKCDVCEADVKDSGFIDGATTMGPWAIMCPACHKTYGVGFGTGRGQLYEPRNNEYVKTAG
jgi:hypothetical protein